MNKDHLIQLVSLALALVALLGSALMVPVVTRQRQDLQLSFDNDSVFASSLGSFKGIAVNALWYRIEMEKRAGRYAEANTLAEMVTDLQPRFPQVWSFHAWNLAYNISVATYTPQERWDWINKGIHLLREEGIRYNPRAVRLYRELAWTLFHKVGQYTDDMNWYYKAEVAREWQEVLGGPNDYLDYEGLKAYMQNIADAGDRYLLFDRPGRALMQDLETLAADIDLIEDKLDDFRWMSVLRLSKQLETVREQLRKDNRPESAARVEALLETVRQAVARAERNPDAVFQEENPQATVAIQALRNGGFELDVTALRAIGKLLMYFRYGQMEWVMSLPDPLMDDDARRMAEVFNNHNTEEFKDSVERYLLPYLRAKVLNETYNMDPAFMSALTDLHGPLDWRHPNTHALYWASRGLDIAEHNVRNDEGFDYTNTFRLVIHSLQGLTDYGAVSFNPLLPAGAQVDLMPNPAFLDAYGNTYKRAFEELEQGEDGAFGQVSQKNFDSGYENYLQKAVMLSYMYGSDAKAQDYYRELRERYGDAYHNQRDKRYEQPIADLIWEFVTEDIGQANTRFFLVATMRRAFQSGLGRGRLNLFSQLMLRCSEFHERYQRERNYETGITEQGRLSLPPFPQMVENEYTRFIQDPQVPLDVRLIAYRNTPLPLAQRTYHRWIGGVENTVPNARELFPEPPDAVKSEDLERGQIEGETLDRM